MIRQVIEARRRNCASIWRKPPASPNTGAAARKPRPGSATPARTWTASTTSARKSANAVAAPGAASAAGRAVHRDPGRARVNQGCQWKALEFRALDARLQRLRERLAREETRLEQLVAEQREAERELETGRARRETASDA